MQEIRLTNNKIAIVDDEDFEFLSKFKWIDRSGYACYVKVVNKKQIIIPMHLMVLKLRKGTLIDHINRNPLDNRKENLRICSKSQNACNTKIHKHNTSGFRGVSKSGSKWRAYIVINDKQKHLGCYETKEEAAFAYNQKAKELFGEFASLNKIKERHAD